MAALMAYLQVDRAAVEAKGCFLAGISGVFLLRRPPDSACLLYNLQVHS